MPWDPRHAVVLDEPHRVGDYARLAGALRDAMRDRVPPAVYVVISKPPEAGESK